MKNAERDITGELSVENGLFAWDDFENDPIETISWDDERCPTCGKALQVGTSAYFNTNHQVFFCFRCERKWRAGLLKEQKPLLRRKGSTRLRWDAW